MRLDKRITEALNAHVSVEATTAFNYITMASWADVRGLNGFAAYFRKEATGEMQHMHQFIRYLNDMDFQATIGDIPAPRHEWTDVRELVEDVYNQENALTQAINDLVSLARDVQDHFTESFLVGFIPSQIEDTASADNLRQRVAMTDSGQGILLIDQELERNTAAG